MAGFFQQFVTDPIGAVTGKEPDDNPSPLDVFTNYVNAGTQYLTGGLVGYGQNGLQRGAVTRAGDEIIGELSGRNLARQALNEANARLVAEDAKRAQDLANERLRREQEDRSASFAASGVRAGTSYSSGGAVFGGGGSYNPDQDFLGL